MSAPSTGAIRCPLPHGSPGAEAGRRLAPLLLVAGLGISLLPAPAASQEELQGERVVMTHEEPRHRVVHEDGDLVVMDVQIQPGDTTLYHTHDSAILYTQISSGQGPAGGNVWSVTSYVEEPFTHRVSNDGDHLFQIIAFANFGEGEPEEADTEPEGVDGELHVENRWFRSYRIELEPGEETGVHRHRHPALVVQTTDGRVDVTRERDGYWSELEGMGDWAWRDEGTEYRIRNVGDEPVSVVVNEAR